MGPNSKSRERSLAREGVEVEEDVEVGFEGSGSGWFEGEHAEDSRVDRVLQA